MTLLLEAIVDGVAVAHPHVDDGQPDSYYADPESRFLFDADEWERRYWHSGDVASALVRSWKAENYDEFARGMERLRRALTAGVVFPVGWLQLAKLFGDGDIMDLGLVSVAVVTDVGMQKVVAVMNTSDAATAVAFKFHGLGTGTTAEAAGDTALVTELTTEYNPDSTRATGSQTTGATTKVYRTVGTNTLDAGTPAVTEHGVFSASSSGSLLDRSKFSAINLTGANGDGIQSTYDLTFTSGG